MRPMMIATAAALSAAMLLLPRAAFAFDVDPSTATNPDGATRFSDPDDAPVALGGLQALGQTGSTHFSDPASTSPGSLQVFGGTLQVYGGTGESAAYGGVPGYNGTPGYIPGSPVSSDLPPLLYSSPAFRSSR
ncbi:MAG: hypothetical protein WB662_10130 [Methyloceanibacter sp.]|jgi:hypothetical protein